MEFGDGNIITPNLTSLAWHHDNPHPAPLSFFLSPFLERIRLSIVRYPQVIEVSQALRSTFLPAMTKLRLHSWLTAHLAKSLADGLLHLEALECIVPSHDDSDEFPSRQDEMQGLFEFFAVANFYRLSDLSIQASLNSPNELWEFCNILAASAPLLQDLSLDFPDMVIQDSVVGFTEMFHSLLTLHTIHHFDFESNTRIVLDCQDAVDVSTAWPNLESFIIICTQHDELDPIPDYYSTSLRVLDILSRGLLALLHLHIEVRLSSWEWSSLPSPGAFANPVRLELLACGVDGVQAVQPLGQSVPPSSPQEQCPVDIAKRMILRAYFHSLWSPGSVFRPVVTGSGTANPVLEWALRTMAPL